MPTPTHPDHGARFQFARRSAEPELAHYDVVVFLPGARTLTLDCLVHRVAELELAGDLAALDAEPASAWLRKQIGLIARSIAKGSVWPRRVTRWKSEP